MSERKESASIACLEEATGTINASGSPEKGDVQNRSVSKAVIFAYLLCALIWGTTWYGVRVCVSPGGFPSYLAAALRFSLASSVLLVIWAVLRTKLKPPSIDEIKWITISGLLSGIGYGLLYVSEEQISGGLAAVLSATAPLIATFIAMRTNTESPSRAAVVGSSIALVGVALVFHDRLAVSPAQATAVGMLGCVCIVNACSNVVMKKHAHGVVALTSNLIFFSAATVMLWLMSLFAGTGTWSFADVQLLPVLALIYLTLFGTLLAFGSFFYLLKRVRLSTAMTLAFITPVLALLVDAFFEKRTILTAESYFGIAIVLAGVTLSVLFKEGRAK